MSDTRGWLDRLVAATNAHDVDAVAACFSSDYRNITPVHPTRGFVGSEQVRRNWEQIFAAAPDVRAEIVASTIDETMAWTEWDVRGSRSDGSQMHLAGVIVFEVNDDQARSARFFLEPVESSGGSVDDAVRAEVLR